MLMHDGINPGMDLFHMGVLGRPRARNHVDGRNNVLPRNRQSILNLKKLSSRLKAIREQHARMVIGRLSEQEAGIDR